MRGGESSNAGDFGRFAEAWLGGLERDGTLAPNAGAALIRRYDGRRDPAEFVKTVVRFLASGEPGRLAYLNPGRPLPPADEHPFATAARYLGPLLSARGKADLASTFAVDVGGMADREGGPPSPGRMAGRMVEVLLRDRELGPMLDPSVRPGPPPWEARVKRVLDAFQSGGYLRRDVDTAELAARSDWRILGLEGEDAAARTIAGRLGSGYRDLLAPGAEPPTVEMSNPFYNAKAEGRTAVSPKDELLSSGLYGI